ncbi:hypothetical protein HYD45_00930 [Mycoplasmopsis bovis]|nr:hypothetical protein [Mycoplasmopsis bovis]QQH78376.1 hypothetical protein HYD45_00930 [Mycoplasmopsis bovis]
MLLCKSYRSYQPSLVYELTKQVPVNSTKKKKYFRELIWENYELQKKSRTQ